MKEALGLQFRDDSEMVRRVREMDWARTPLGAVEAWPEALKAAVGICLNSRYPMFVWWGDELINIYNDAYIPVLGKRHPEALGRPAREIWREIWDVVGPQAEVVMGRGESTWNDRVLLMMERNGFLEETYFSWSYSPIPDGKGGVGGLFCVCTEETGRVLAERERDRLAGQRQLALDSARMGWWHFDPVTKTSSYDDRFREIFGITAGDRENEEVVARIHPDDRPAMLRKVAAALDPVNPKPYVAEYRVIRDDGAAVWVEARGATTFEGEGAARRAVSFVGTVADVTERKLAEERPRQILESVTDAFFAVDTRWRFTYLNPHAERLLGHPLAELIGRVMWDQFPGLSGSEFEAAYRRAASERVAVSVTGYYPDHQRWYAVHAYPASGDGGITVYFQDVTARKVAEERIRASERQMRLLTDALPALIGYVDRDEHYRFANRAYLDWFGIDPTGKHLTEVLGDAGYRERLPHVEAALRGETVRFEATSPHRTRGPIECEILYVPDLTEGCEVRGFVVLVQDVTDRRRAEEALTASESQLRTVTNVLPAFVWSGDPDGRVYHFNDRWYEYTGLTPRESEGFGWTRTLHPDDVARCVAAWEAARAAGRDYEVEVRYRRHDGEYRWYLARAVPVRDAAGTVTGWIGASSDIDDRRRVEQALRESEGRFRNMSDHAPVMIWVTRPDGHCDYLNRLWMEFTGQTMAEAAGFGWVDAVHPDDRAATHEAFVAANARRGPFEVEYRLRRHDGVYRWCVDAAAPRFGEDGEFLGYIGSVIDVHDRRTAGEERDRLLQAERAARAEAERANEAKNEFLATLSHELRTPLTPVLLTVSMMESRPDLPADLREDVASIKRNVELESRLISDLLDLTRIAKGKMQIDDHDVDLHRVVRSAIHICQREASAKMTVELHAGRHTVRGDATRLQQIFWNLVSNAIKFTPADGEIVVKSREVDGGRRVRVEVADTGMGIDPEILPRLFNAFEQGEVRTAKQFAGLGLGLAISRKLAEAHGGTIQVSSEGRGRGSTFAVELPLLATPLSPSHGNGAPPRPPAGAPDAPARSLSVLLVEDHEATLNVMSRLLRGMGHRVTGATSVASALAAAGQDGFDVIVSDLGLPDGSGLDVMRQLRGKYAGRAIALTGYGMESDVAASREAGFAEHLIKPVGLQQLQAAIGRVGYGRGS